MANTADLPFLNSPFKNPKYIFFTDFDGTITLQDSNDYMVKAFGIYPLHDPLRGLASQHQNDSDRSAQTDNIGYGEEKRKAGNKSVLDGKETFR